MAAVSLVFPSPRAPWSRTLRRAGSLEAGSGHDRARRLAPRRRARRDGFTPTVVASPMPRGRISNLVHIVDFSARLGPTRTSPGASVALDAVDGFAQNRADLRRSARDPRRWARRRGPGGGSGQARSVPGDGAQRADPKSPAAGGSAQSRALAVPTRRPHHAREYLREVPGFELRRPAVLLRARHRRRGGNRAHRYRLSKRASPRVPGRVLLVYDGRSAEVPAHLAPLAPPSRSPDGGRDRGRAQPPRRVRWLREESHPTVL